MEGYELRAMDYLTKPFVQRDVDRAARDADGDRLVADGEHTERFQQNVLQSLRFTGLDQIVERVDRKSLESILPGGRQKDDQQPGIRFPELLCQLDPVHFAHADVKENDAEALRPGLFEKAFGAGKDLDVHFLPTALKEVPDLAPEPFPVRGEIIHDRKMKLHGSPSPFPVRS